jgi:hypothetical protein
MRSKMHRRYVKNSGTPKSNPPLFTELLEFAGPGFGAFAVTRLGTRIAATQVEKWKPSWGKHAGAVASVSAFLAAWFLGHRVKFLAKYHTPITVGAAIAMAQSLIQLYLPKLGWMVADATPDMVAAGLTSNVAMLTASSDLQPTDDDPNEFTYNDSFDAGRFAKIDPQASGQAAPVGPDTADLAIDDAIGQSANLGVFSN